jgi:hypothetical protein
MKLSLRTSILVGIAVVLLLMTIPSTIRAFMDQGPYLFTHQFFEDLLARLWGPGRLRFVVQPVVASFLGFRDGSKDKRLGLPPFFLILVRHASQRGDLLRGAFNSVRDLVVLAIIADLVAQYLIFRRVNAPAALLVGPVLIAGPYSLLRALANLPSAQRPRGAAQPL